MKYFVDDDDDDHNDNNKREADSIANSVPCKKRKISKSPDVNDDSATEFAEAKEVLDVKQNTDVEDISVSNPHVESGTIKLETANKTVIDKKIAEMPNVKERFSRKRKATSKTYTSAPKKPRTDGDGDISFSKIIQNLKDVNAHYTKSQTAHLPNSNTLGTLGNLFVLGMNEVGQIGMNVDETSYEQYPSPLLHPQCFIDIAAGGMHSICLSSEGKVFSFGCNDEGALGRCTSNEIEEALPGEVKIQGVVIQVSAGDSHSAALTEEGEVFIWGNFRNKNGALGLLEKGKKCTEPQRILPDIVITTIVSGADHFVCLSDCGEVYSCGDAEQGQLGRFSEISLITTAEEEQLQPKIVPLKSDIVPVSHIWVGLYNTYIKSQSGDIYACGLNNCGQLGLPLVSNDTHENIIFSFQLINSFSSNQNWQHINGGQHHALALDSDGRVYSLGRKDYGRLGLGLNINSATIDIPTLIPNLIDRKCIDISCGDIVSFAVTENGQAYSWGFGTNYQLGHDSTEDAHEPKIFDGDFHQYWSVIRVSGGGQHTLILANKKETVNNIQSNHEDEL